jgi:hypothetical protein
VSFIENLLGQSWKKFASLIAAILILVFQGDNLSIEVQESLRWIISAFLVGQGVADFGKGRALVESNPKT